MRAAPPAPVGASRLDRLQRWLRLEALDPARYAANMASWGGKDRVGGRAGGGGGARPGGQRQCPCRGRTRRPARQTHPAHTAPRIPPLPTTPQSLLRAVGLFVGGVIVARNFGDAFNV